MPRQRIGDKKRGTGVTLYPDTMQAVDEIAQERRWSRSQTIRELVESGLSVFRNNASRAAAM